MSKTLSQMTGPERADLRRMIAKHVVATERNPADWAGRVKIIAKNLGLDTIRVEWSHPILDQALFSVLSEADKRQRTEAQVLAAAGLE